MAKTTLEITHFGLYLVNRFHSNTPLTVQELYAGYEDELKETDEDITFFDSALILAEFIVEENFLSIEKYIPGSIGTQQYIYFQVEKYFANIWTYFKRIHAPAIENEITGNLDAYILFTSLFASFFYNRSQNHLIS